MSDGVKALIPFELLNRHNLFKPSNSTVNLIIFLFYLVPFQDLAGSVIFLLNFPDPLVKLLVGLKEGITVLLGISVLFRTHFSPVRWLLLLFVLYASVLVLFSTLPIMEVLLGFRTYILLFFAFVLGETLMLDSGERLRVKKHFRIVLFLLLAFGILEHWILPLSIWTDVFPIFEMKRTVIGLSGANELEESGLPVNAFTESGKRLLGPFNEPLYMAYYAVILVNFLITSAYYKSERKLAMILGVLCVYLTKTRAVMLGLIISWIMLVGRKYTRCVALSSCVAIIWIGLSDAWYGLADYFFDFEDGRTIGHILAYTEGIHNAVRNPMGMGVGYATSIVNFAADVDLEFHTENAFINTWIEIGVIGLLILLGFYANLFFRFNRFLQKRDLPDEKNVIVGSAYLLLIQFIIAGFLAPHILTARILVPSMIVFGWAYSIVYSERK